jgi:hypothetical protein
MQSAYCQLFFVLGSSRGGEKACMQEMMEVMACLNKFGGDQVLLQNTAWEFFWHKQSGIIFS